MQGVHSVQCDREIRDAPEWVQLLPFGRIAARDGRRFTNADQEKIIADFQARAVDLPIDYEHQNDKPLPKLIGPVPVAGWIKELAARTDGLWGRVEWTERARNLIHNREYRYLSPSMLVDKASREIVRLKGAVLVHNPALHIAALASQEDTMADTTELLMRLAQTLDLPEDADEEAILEALAVRLKDGKPDPRKYVPAEAVQNMMRELSQERTTTRQERAQAKVADAMQNGYLIPAMRDWATELCMADETSFDQFVASSIPTFANLARPLLDGVPPGSETPGAATPEVTLLSEQLGIDPNSLL